MLQGKNIGQIILDDDPRSIGKFWAALDMEIKKWFKKKTTHGVSRIVHAVLADHEHAYSLCNQRTRIKLANLDPIESPEDLGLKECEHCKKEIAATVQARLQGAKPWKGADTGNYWVSGFPQEDGK